MMKLKFGLNDLKVQKSFLIILLRHIKPVNGQQLSLFQILLSNIAYNVIIEIVYLVTLITISLVQNIFSVALLKYITAICIFMILHILLVLLESVAQMYLTFWANRK